MLPARAPSHLECQSVVAFIGIPIPDSLTSPTSRFGNGSEHYVQQLQRKWFLGRLGILHSIRVPVSIVRIELPFFIFYFLFSFAACCNGDVAPLLHCNE